MRIYFVRHGHPNYRDDCLTDLGNLQAKACSDRLENEGIQKIFASSHGRAMETAGYTAKKLGLDVEPIDFIREVHWCSKTEAPIFKDGNPWFVADDMVLNGEDIFDKNWAENPRFSCSVIGEHAKRVADGIDSWLRDFGYEREGNYYRVVGDNTKQTVAIFSHGGASSAALSHLLNVPFSWFVEVTRLNFTSITVVDFGDEVGTLTFPRLALLNDARHIEGIDSDLFFGN